MFLFGKVIFVEVEYFCCICYNDFCW